MRDGLALLRGERTFVMTMEDGETIITKVKKASSSSPKPRICASTLKVKPSETTRPLTFLEPSCVILTMTDEKWRFYSLLKPILIETSSSLRSLPRRPKPTFTNALTYNSERLKVNITKDKDVGNPSELRISTTLVASNLPQRES
jgi:hypothetical protein